ncbi:thermonuclease family protein [Patescibacteria group bacterium]|nr:thermonuclease family protein [Patescibacteria group bacterium]
MSRGVTFSLPIILLSLLFIVILAVWISWQRPEIKTVVKVVDGDTIILDNGETVRYIGIDTPEVSVPVTDLECYGPEATIRNEELVAGREVKMIRDIKNRDKYGRLLRYVYLTSDDTFINLELVKDGYARSLAVYPNVSYTKEIKSATEAAQRDKKGLWSENNCPLTK